MLHLVAFKPDNKALLAQLVAAAGSGDVLVLIDDGCAFADSPKTLAALPQGCELYLVSESTARTPAAPVTHIDYIGLITLTESHATILSWFNTH